MKITLNLLMILALVALSVYALDEAAVADNSASLSCGCDGEKPKDDEDKQTANNDDAFDDGYHTWRNDGKLAFGAIDPVDDSQDDYRNWRISIHLADPSEVDGLGSDGEIA